MATLQHRNRAVAFRSPIDGVTERVNTDLLDRNEILSVEPQVDSWLFRIRPSNPRDVTEGLMIGQAARDWLSREIGRMKVILSTLAPQNMAVDLSPLVIAQVVDRFSQGLGAATNLSDGT